MADFYVLSLLLFPEIKLDIFDFLVISEIIDRDLSPKKLFSSFDPLCRLLCYVSIVFVAMLSLAGGEGSLSALPISIVWYFSVKH